MDNYGKGVSDVLQGLIASRSISKIKIYRFMDNKLFLENEQWSFGHEFIQVGNQSYNLNKLIKYQFDGSELSLHF